MRAGRQQCLTESTAPELGPPDLGKFYALPRAELPEAFPRFEEDSFEDMLPRGGCRGLQARSPGQTLSLCFDFIRTQSFERMLLHGRCGLWSQIPAYAPLSCTSVFLGSWRLACPCSA